MAMSKRLHAGVYRYTVDHNENGQVVIQQWSDYGKYGEILLDDETAEKLAQSISEVASQSRTERLKRRAV
jgi:predicted oxidoreductase